MVIRAHEMVGRRLRRGVRAVRRVGRRLGECRIGGAERSVHLVGRHVHEPECRAFGGGQVRPPGLRRVEQPERRDDVGLDERGGAVDRPVDVRLGGEVDDRARPVLAQQRGHERGVADVAAHEDMPAVLRERREVAEVACVREQVEIDDGLAGRGKPIEHEVGADEAGAAGHEDHGCLRRDAGSDPAGRNGRFYQRGGRLPVIGRRNPPAGRSPGAHGRLIGQSSRDTRRRTARGLRRAACSARTRPRRAAGRWTRRSPPCRPAASARTRRSRSGPAGARASR